MVQFIPSPVPRSLVEGIDGAFIGTGAGADLDGAFDDAMETAWFDYGRAGAVPTVADADPTSVSVVEGPTTSQTAAVAAAVRHLHSGHAKLGVVYAVPFSRDSAFARRKVRVTFDDPALQIGHEPAVLPWLPETTESAVLTLLAGAGVELAEGESVESVQVVRVRARYKVVAASNKGKLTATYAVRDVATGELVSTGHASVVLARRAAAAAAKLLGPEAGEVAWEVIGLTGRPDGLAHAAVTRSRIVQKGALRVTLAKAKAEPPVLAWLFYGLGGPGVEADVVSVDAAGVEAPEPADAQSADAG